jgi:hypothetical protein
MAAGRPPSNRPTRMVRVAEDLAEKLGWIADINDDTTIADFVDPILRPAVNAAFDRIKPTVEKIQAARELHIVHAADLGEAGA